MENRYVGTVIFNGQFVIDFEEARKGMLNAWWNRNKTHCFNTFVRFHLLREISSRVLLMLDMALVDVCVIVSDSYYPISFDFNIYY